MKRALAAISLILTLSSAAIGQNNGAPLVAAAKATDEQSIKKVLADFARGWNAHEAKEFSTVFAVDADFTNVRGVSAQGRSEVEKFHASRFATYFKDTHLTIEETKIRFIKPDVAEVDARWEMTGARDPEGHVIPLRNAGFCHDQ
jgi:uncharacterized protein (TIGR02246 family)